MSSGRPSEEEPARQGPTVRDRRRIDPTTYQVREPEAQPQAGAPAPGPGVGSIDTEGSRVAELEVALAERTMDLQRLQAEYVNYKRRVDRDRDAVRAGAVEGVLRDLLSTLDDVRSAREHDELNGGFKAVGEGLERVATKYGLEVFGAKGDPFDPHIHEALLHSYAEGVQGPTCVEILQPGFRVGDRVLRPARVAVAEPDPSATPTESVREPTGLAEPGGSTPAEPRTADPASSTDS